MYLTRHQTAGGPRWALNERYLPVAFNLGLLLQLPASSVRPLLEQFPAGPEASDPLLAPVEPDDEIWAAGVTYLRSREAREHESATGDIYQHIYDAERPEIFPKAVGWRAVGHGCPIRVRTDSDWNVPEPELVIVLNHEMEIVGYSAGNDVSSRAIEGANPLYLPQAKIFDRSCALGPGIVLSDADEVSDLPITLEIERNGVAHFTGESGTSQMKRSPRELAAYLGRELQFPDGAFLMTGTGIIPPDEFSLRSGDIVTIQVGSLRLSNPVQP